MRFFYLIFPFIIFWLVFNVLSIISGIVYVYKNVGIAESFSFVFNDPLFWISLKNSFVYCLIVIPLQLFSFFLAFTIYSLSNRWASFFRIILYLPVVVPIASIGFVFKIMFNDEGTVNDFLLKIFGLKIPFLSNYYYSMLVAFMLTFWKGLGYYVVIYLSSLYSISKEIIENSVMDGMSFFQRMWYIYLPLLKGTFYFASFLSMLAALKVFAEIFIVTEGGPGTSTYTLMMYIYSRAFHSFDLPTAIAASFILSFIAIFLSLFIFKRQIENIKI
ncbi:MAG: sugar ABC transporter permease [bacterium]|nr:sugar ABC transporter permease [bacterium]